MNTEAKIEIKDLMVSASPHIRCEESISKVMWSVNAALAPAALFSVYNFGMPALFIMVLCIVAAMATEYLILKWQDKPMVVNDGSAFLTGLLLAMNIPATLPWYMPLAGTIFAIAVAKHTMGGLGFNIFNPALIGRAFILASWPIAMTTWPLSKDMIGKVDSLTAATPLGILKMEGYEKLVATFGDQAAMYKSLLFGLRAGSAGETSALLLILGGIYLIYKGYIKWQVPVVMIGTVGALTAAFGGDPLLHMMSGGLILGAFYMATDMVTIPITTKGQIIFAVGAGALTVLIRLQGGYPEGVCYAILLMNCVTPLIDRVVRPVKYGARR
ncbi:MAG: RnfABCDGE type electron transport complex subunit D [Sporomusaceae bacterium]|nr:RnfABCDGE type electron transport complex subunit D [Sporomusaceae bacterium]